MHKTIACHLTEQAAKCPINRSDLLGCIAFSMDFSDSWAGVEIKGTEFFYNLGCKNYNPGCKGFLMKIRRSHFR